jgi:hypothetical protein
MCKMTQEVGSQKCKGQMQMWTEYEQTVNQLCYLEVLTKLGESVQRKRPKLWPDMWILHHNNAPVHDACSWLRNPLKNGPSTLFTWLSPLQFLAFSEIKKCPEGPKICWHSKQRDVTARYFGKQFSRLFPAVAPLSHQVRSFTKKVFRRRQQPLVHSYANFAFTRHSKN